MDDSRVYNCAAVVANGEIRGLVPKQYLPNRAEFYEDRWFTRALGRELPIRHRDIPFGTDLLFDLERPGHRLGIELCEDLWAVEPPSGRLALAGATIIVNPSASPEVLGKAGYRRDLVAQQSARCLAAYAYAGSGPGESSTRSGAASRARSTVHSSLRTTTGSAPNSPRYCTRL